MRDDTNYWLRRRLGRRQVLRNTGVAVPGLAAAALIGCGGDDSSNDGGPDPAATASGTADSSGTASPDASTTPVGGSGEPQSGGELRLALTDDPSGLDPSTSRSGYDYDYLYSIYDTLVNIGPKLEPQPGIAESWEIEDELTIAFKVNTGFKYHDGTDFKADDIRYTIERHQDPATASYSAGQVQSIDQVEVVDDETVVFRLNAVTASLLAILGDRPGMMLSPTAVDERGELFTQQPVGSGPMMLDNWAIESSLKMRRFGEYRREGYPYLDTIDFQVVPDSSVQFANVRTDRTDIIEVATKDVDAARNESNLQFVEWPSIAYTQVNINISQDPLTDKRVRQAMSHSLNRQAILDGIFFGQGEVANAPITRASWAYYEALLPPEEDLQKAQQLFSAAYPDGHAWQMVFVPNEENTPLAEMLKAQWARIGIDLELVGRRSQEAGEEYRNQLYPMGATFGFSGRADPDLTLFENFHSTGGFNRASFNEDYTPDEDQVALDDLIERGRQTYDMEERKTIYDEAQRLIVENVHGLLFTHAVNQFALSSRVRGFVPYGDGKLRLHELWLDA